MCPSSARAPTKKGSGLPRLAGKLEPERRARFEADVTAFHAWFAGKLGIAVSRDYWIVHGSH